MSALQKIFGILEPYLSESRDSKRVREILERVHFPDIVVNWNFEIGEDWTGDPLVRIYVFLKDETIENPGWHEETFEIEKRIRTAFFDEEVPWRPSVRFRTASEQRSLKNLAS